MSATRDSFEVVLEEFKRKLTSREVRDFQFVTEGSRELEKDDEYGST